MRAEVATAAVAERQHIRVKGRPRRRPLWRRPRWWVLGGALVLLLLLALAAYRYTSAVLALASGRDDVQAAHQLLSTDLTHLDGQRVAAAEQDLELAADDFGSRSQILSSGWLAQAGMHLPWISDQVNGANALRSAGRAGTLVALDLVRLAHDVVAPTGSKPSSPLQRIVALAGAQREAVHAALGDLASFQQALSAVPHTPLAGPLESARHAVLADGTELVNGASPALAILNALPAAIGPGTHHYLVLLENPGEERPSGGYIGAVGVATFTDGQLSDLQFQDSAAYAPPSPAIPIPGALDRYLFHEAPWELEDANWSPDFATAMADVERFYTAATGSHVDGDISIDPVAIEYLLRLLGPVQVPPYPQVITSTNALRELNYISNSARPGDPGKAFLAPFGRVVTQELLSAPVADLPGIASSLQRAAEEKHVVVYFHNADLQRLVTGAGFGGTLHARSSDSVMVDDANLSGTKGDLFVQRHFRLAVRVNADGTADDQLSLTYSNPAITDRADKALVPGSGGQYRDYLRVLLPETSQLHAVAASVNGQAAAQLAPESIAYTFGQEAIGIWFAVPVGGTETLTLTYSGPFADISLTPEHYQLTWVKQVNALPWPVQVTVRMPTGRTRRWDASLATDRTWSIAG